MALRTDYLYDCNVAVQSGGVEVLVPHDPSDPPDGRPRFVAPPKVVIAQADGDVVDVKCTQTKINTMLVTL